MSTKRLSKKQAALVAPSAPKKIKAYRVKKLGKLLLLVGSVLLAFFSWGYRLFDLGLIVGSGGMGDLIDYYQASMHLLSNQPIWVIGERAPFGPPSTLVPFLPLLLIPRTLVHFAVSLANVIFFGFAWMLVAKRFAKRFTFKQSSWWLALAFMAWSFPVSYSLGAGNPMGLVTWGIYGYLLTTSLVATLGLAVLITLKLFPAVVLLATTKKKPDLLRVGVVSGITIAIMASSLVLWSAQWRSYVAYVFHIMSLSTANTDFALHNQSMGSMLGRLGVSGSWLSFFVMGWSIGLIALVTLWLASAKPWKKLTLERRLVWGMRLLTAILLIHPTPWQYYHAIFVPYILLRVMQKQIAYLPALLLISFNGAWLPQTFPGASLLASSQWFGLLLLLVIEFWLSKRSSIDQIIKDRGFFNPVSSN
jgi:hypothetical protein